MHVHANNATSCCGWKPPGRLPAYGGGYPQRYKGCELTWGREPEEAVEVVVVVVEGVGGRVVDGKGSQMGQTIGLRHPPCMSTTPSPLQTSATLHIQTEG